MKNKTNDRIINEKNSLSNWKEKKENLNLRDCQIMQKKTQTDLKTQNLDEIINILVNEIKTYPKFFDSCDNIQSNEIYEELVKEAKTLGQIYIQNKKKGMMKLINK